jgi:hypothetical protein
MKLASSGVEYYSENSRPYGKTYGSWTVEWWRWALSMPRSISPLFDETGELAGANQPSQVWFLGGKFGNEEHSMPKRECHIPYNRSILFPIINCEANSLECPELNTDDDLINHVRHDVGTVVKKECFVNNERIPSLRIQSDPILFRVNVSDDLFDIPHGGQTLASADGYWVFLKAPPKGKYDIRFAGACELGKLNAGAEYQIRIV